MQDGQLMPRLPAGNRKSQTNWAVIIGVAALSTLLILSAAYISFSWRSALSHGYTRLVYSVHTEHKIDWFKLREAIARRVEMAGVEQCEIRIYPDGRFEIVFELVDSDELEQIKQLITTPGSLRFMIVANQKDHGDLWRWADDPQRTDQNEVRDTHGRIVGRWVRLSVDPKASKTDQPVYRVDPAGSKNRGSVGHKEILVVESKLTGDHLTSVRSGFKDIDPCVYFDLSPSGARLMQELTAGSRPDDQSDHYTLLGIVMDNELIAAPRINEQISSSGMIEGSFSRDEVETLVQVLRAGQLPAYVDRIPLTEEIVPADPAEPFRIRIALLFGIGIQVAALLFLCFRYGLLGASERLSEVDERAVPRRIEQMLERVERLEAQRRLKRKDSAKGTEKGATANRSD